MPLINSNVFYSTSEVSALEVFGVHCGFYKFHNLVQQIQEIVTLEAAAMDPSKVIRATQNFRRRVELCRIKTGGHFEADIQKFKI